MQLNRKGPLYEDNDLDVILNSLDHIDELKVRKPAVKQNGDSNLRLEGHPEQTTRPKKSIKSILDSLVDPFEDPILPKTEKSASQLDFEKQDESKRHPNLSVSKGTVGFLDNMENGYQELLGNKQFDLKQFDLEKQTTKTSYNTDLPDSNGLQKAPISSEFRQFTFENSLLDDDDINSNKKSHPNQIPTLLIDKKLTDNSRLIESTQSQPHHRPSPLESANRITMPQQQSSDFEKLDIDRPRSTSSFACLSASIDRKNANHKFIEQEAQIKRLEMERDNLINLLDLNKKKHREELLILEQTSKTKLDLLKESAHYKERLLQEEINYLEAQNRERLKQIEKRDQLVTDLTNKLNETRQAHQRELNESKQTHNEEIAMLKKHHQEEIDRLKSATQLEMHITNESQTNSEQLKNLFTQIQTTLMDLSKLEQEHIKNINIRNDQLTRREDALRLLEDQINQRDRWSMKQEHDRLAKLQINSEEEKRCFTEQSAKALSQLQQLVSDFITEHRNAQAKMSDEHNFSSEEHQRLRDKQSNRKAKQKSNDLVLKRAQEDIDSMKEALTLERQSFNEKMKQLNIDKNKLEETRQQLEIVRLDLVRGQELLTHREQYLDEREHELNKRDVVLKQTEKRLKESETRHRRLHDEQIELFTEIKEKNRKLFEAENQIVLEKRRLAQQTEKLVTYKLESDNSLRQSICLNCRIPIRECNSSYDLHCGLENDDGNTVNETAGKRIINTNGIRKGGILSSNQ
ncbi:unnamed protein product [Schistosoma turkestanicum]|nr:unnamed protein product [Schistosoma turkestanicum]